MLVDAPLPQLSSHGVPLNGPVAANATWLDRNGKVQTGLVPVSAGQQAGEHVSIWLDRSGAVTEAPLNVTDAAARAIIVGLGGWLVVGLVLAGVVAAGLLASGMAPLEAARVVAHRFSVSVRQGRRYVEGAASGPDAAWHL